MLKVTYLDHSGFAVTTPDVFLVFDFYKDPVKALHKLLDEYPEKPVVFFVTHHHPDHFNESIFELAQNHERTYVLSDDIHSQRVPKKGLQVAWMHAGDYIEDLPGGIAVRAYGSTDEGVSYGVTLPGGDVVFHAGDLNDWRWDEESTPEEVAKAERDFTTILHRIAQSMPVCRIAMFPVDARQGGNYTRGASLFLSTIKVDNFFPMHFWGESDKACMFAAYNPTPSTQCHCLDRPGESVMIAE